MPTATETNNSAATEVVSIIKEAGALAVETDDYVTYATVLDLRIAPAETYTPEQARDILNALYETLCKYDKLVYGVGWDLPAVILPFLRFGHGEFGREQLLPLVRNLFTQLCLQGNHKELFLKSSELLLRLSEEAEEEADYDDESSDTETERGFDPDSEPLGGRLVDEEPPLVEAGYKDPTSAESQRARLRDVKAKMLYELMRVSLSYIESDYPTRFLKSAATTLLTVASDPDADVPSMTINLRHLFLFGRDFQMETAGASVGEAQRTGELLQNYVTHAAEVTMERISIKWADRLYYQLVNKIALADPKVRDAAYHINVYTERINEAMSRLAQLAQSYDLDVADGWCELLEKAIKGSGATVDDEPEDILDTPSAAGVLLLATQAHFDGPRTNKVPYDQVVSVINLLSESVPQSLGVRDAMLYWMLWSSTSATVEDVQSLPRDDFSHYLQAVLHIANSVSRDTRHIAYSAVTKLLRLQKPELAYEFLIDTFEYCPYDSVLDAAVQMLKVLLTGKLKCQIGVDPKLSREMVSETPSDNLLVLDQAKKQKILDVVDLSVNDFIYDGAGIPLLLSWLNLLTVVDLDDDRVREVVDKLQKFIESDAAKDLPENLAGVLKLAIESIEKARFK